jgi:hypothetical protein
MTTETLFDTLKYIVKIDPELQLQASLQAVSASLASLVQTPAQPAVQQALATAMTALDKATASLRDRLTLSHIEHIAEIGGAEYFDPSMTDEVRKSIATNAMTPSVASAYVQDVLTRRAAFLQNVKQTLSGMEELTLSGSTPPTGRADITFIIPRSLFGSQLEPFAKELTFIARLVRDVSEAETGSAEAPTLESLASSDPTVAILASVGAIKIVAETVKAFLDVWKQVQEVRDARQQITKLGLSGAAVAELDDRITAIVEETVTSTTTTTMSLYKGDPGRRNELETSVRQNTRRLFGQIEQGLIVQFRAEPDESANDEKQEDLKTIAVLSRAMEFPAVTTTPLLLQAGQIIEGDVAAFTTTTTTNTRTTTKTNGGEPATKRAKKVKT